MAVIIQHMRGEPPGAGASSISRRTHLSPTLRSYATSLEQYRLFLRVRHRCIRSATFEDVLDFAASLHARAPNTACTRLAAVRAIHRYLHALGHTTRDVAALVPNPKRRRGEVPAPSAEAVERVRAQLVSCRDQALFGLMYDSLLRIESVLHLRVDNIDLERREVTVVVKGDCWRTVSISRWTARALDAWLEHRHRAGAPFAFPSYRAGNAGPMSTIPVYRMLAGAVDAAGASGRWTPHALRRAMARHLVDAGASPFDVQDALTHETMSVTSEYVRASAPQAITDELRERIAAHAAQRSA